MYTPYMFQVLSTPGQCLHDICMSSSQSQMCHLAISCTIYLLVSLLSFCFCRFFPTPGISPSSYPFTPAPPILPCEAAGLYPPMGQVLLSPHALPPGHPYYPASAQLYMNYTAYYPRYTRPCLETPPKAVRHDLGSFFSGKMPGRDKGS